MTYLIALSPAIVFVVLCAWLDSISRTLQDLANPVDTSDWPDPDDY